MEKECEQLAGKLVDLRLDNNHHLKDSPCPASSSTPSAHHHSPPTSSSPIRSHTRPHRPAKLDKVRKLKVSGSPRTPGGTPTASPAAGDLASQSPEDANMVDANAAGTANQPPQLSQKNANAATPPMLRGSVPAPLLSCLPDSNDMPDSNDFENLREHPEQENQEYRNWVE